MAVANPQLPAALQRKRGEATRKVSRSTGDELI